MVRRFTCAVAIAILAGLAGPGAARPDSSALQESEQTEPPADESPPAPETAPPEAPAEPAVEPQRVIIRVDRNREVAGWVELEDETVIVVRTPRGEVESFARGRIAGVVRLVEPDPGQTGQVRLRNGQSRSGVILADTFEYVELEIEGVRTRLGRDVVDTVFLEPTFDEKYRHFKSTIAPDMTSRHLDLCRWLIGQRRFDLAKDELLELLERTENADARKLLRVAEASLELEQANEQGGAAVPRADVEGGEERASDDDPSGDDGRVEHPLGSGDVNLMRVYEIDFDRPPRLAVRSQTVAKIIETYGTNKLVPADEEGRRKLYQAKPIDVVRLMFELRARELYAEIDVISEPYALNLFRQRVHDTWLMNNCATSRCHGSSQPSEPRASQPSGPRALQPSGLQREGADGAGETPAGGRFLLYRRGSRDARTRYANLLILERLEIEPEWPLVNYQKPGDSLIIQYGLPRTVARKPHPPARGWKPAFRDIEDRMVTDTERWIRSMYQPRPDYGVDFVPPEPAAAPVGEEPEGGGVEQERERQPR